MMQEPSATPSTIIVISPSLLAPEVRTAAPPHDPRTEQFIAPVDYCAGAKYPPRLATCAVAPGIPICTARHAPSRVEFVDV